MNFSPLAHKVFRWCVVIAVCFDILALTYIGYLAFWPIKTIEVIGHDQILNPNKQVRIGAALVYKVKYCKYLDVEAHVHRTLAGTINYPLPDSTNHIPTGCRTAVSRNTIIPVGVAPGKYRLQLTASYHVNPVRTIEVSHFSEEFEVLPPDDTTSSTSDATSSSVSPSSAGKVQVVVSQRSVAPAASPVPFGTDPVTEEPTQPTPAPPAQPAATPSLLNTAISSIKGVIGISQ
jgi:hypothetical protein